MIEQLPDATVIARPLDFPPKIGDRVDVTFWSGDRLRGTIANDGRIVLDAYSVREAHNRWRCSVRPARATTRSTSSAGNSRVNTPIEM